jgi:hypothetical protein
MNELTANQKIRMDAIEAIPVDNTPRGIPRTREDIKKIVLEIVSDTDPTHWWRFHTDKVLAAHVGVSAGYISKIRRQYENDIKPNLNSVLKGS